MKSSKLLNELGMSMVSVTMAAGLLAVLGLGVMRTSQNAQMVSSKLTSDFSLNTYKTSIVRIMGLAQNANEFLQGVDLSGLAGGNVNLCGAGARDLEERDPNGNLIRVALRRNTKIFNEASNPWSVIDSDDCMYFPQQGTFVDAASPQTINVSFVVKLTRDTTMKKMMGGPGASIQVFLTVALDNNSRIAQVWASNMDAERAACNSLRGFYDEIDRACYNPWISSPGAGLPNYNAATAPVPTRTTSNRIQANFLDAENGICIGADCISTWTTRYLACTGFSVRSSCPANQVVTGVQVTASTRNDTHRHSLPQTNNFTIPIISSSTHNSPTRNSPNVTLNNVTITGATSTGSASVSGSTSNNGDGQYGHSHSFNAGSHSHSISHNHGTHNHGSHNHGSHNHGSHRHTHSHGAHRHTMPNMANDTHNHTADTIVSLSCCSLRTGPN